MKRHAIAGGVIHHLVVKIGHGLLGFVVCRDPHCVGIRISSLWYEVVSTAYGPTFRDADE